MAELYCRPLINTSPSPLPVNHESSSLPQDNATLPCWEKEGRREDCGIRNKNVWRKNRTGNRGGQSVLTEEELEKEGGGKAGRNDEEKRENDKRVEDPMRERRKNMKEIRILMPRESYEGGRHGLETLQDGHERITWNRGKTEWKEDGAEKPVKGAVG